MESPGSRTATQWSLGSMGGRGYIEGQGGKARDREGYHPIHHRPVHDLPRRHCVPAIIGFLSRDQIAW